MSDLLLWQFLSASIIIIIIIIKIKTYLYRYSLTVNTNRASSGGGVDKFGSQEEGSTPYPPPSPMCGYSYKHIYTRSITPTKLFTLEKDDLNRCLLLYHTFPYGTLSQPQKKSKWWLKSTKMALWKDLCCSTTVPVPPNRWWYCPT